MIIFMMIVFHYQAKCITSWQVNFLIFSLHTEASNPHSCICNPPIFSGWTSMFFMLVVHLSVESFLNLTSINIGNGRFCFVEGCFLHCRMFISIHGLDPGSASYYFSPGMRTKNLQHCQNPLGSKTFRHSKTENFWSTTYELSVPFLSIAIENSFSSMPSWNPTF